MTSNLQAPPPGFTPRPYTGPFRSFVHVYSMCKCFKEVPSVLFLANIKGKETLLRIHFNRSYTLSHKPVGKGQVTAAPLTAAKL